MLHFPHSRHYELPSNWKELYGRPPRDEGAARVSDDDRCMRRKYMSVLEALEKEVRLKQKLARELSGGWPSFKDYEACKASRELQAARSHIEVLETQTVAVKSRLAQQLGDEAERERCALAALQSQLTTTRLECEERAKRVAWLKEQHVVLENKAAERTRVVKVSVGCGMSVEDGVACRCATCSAALAECAAVKAEIERVGSHDVAGLAERHRLSSDLQAVEEVAADMERQLKSLRAKVSRAETAADREKRRRARLEGKINSAKARVVQAFQARSKAEKNWRQQKAKHEAEYAALATEIARLQQTIATQEGLLTTDLVNNVNTHEQLLEANEELSAKLAAIRTKEHRMSARVSGKAKVARAVHQAAQQVRAEHHDRANAQAQAIATYGAASTEMLDATATVSQGSASASTGDMDGGGESGDSDGGSVVSPTVDADEVLARLLEESEA